MRQIPKKLLREKEELIKRLYASMGMMEVVPPKSGKKVNLANLGKHVRIKSRQSGKDFETDPNVTVDVEAQIELRKKLAEVDEAIQNFLCRPEDTIEQ